MNDSNSNLQESIWKAVNQSDERIESKETTFEFVQRHPEMHDVRNLIDVALHQLPTDARRSDAVRRMKSRRHHQFVDVVFELFTNAHVIDCGFVVADHDGPDVYVPGEFAVEATICHSPKHKPSASETALLDELRDRLDEGDPLGVWFSLSSNGNLTNSDGISPKSLEKAIREQATVFLATGKKQQRYLRPDEEWRNRWHYTGPVARYLYESEDWSLWISWMTKTNNAHGGIGSWPVISFVGPRWQDGFRRKLKAKARQVNKWNLDVPVYLAVGFGESFFLGDEYNAIQDVWYEEASSQFCGLWVSNAVLSPQLDRPRFELIPPMGGEVPRESELMIPRIGEEIKTRI